MALAERPIKTRMAAASRGRQAVSLDPVAISGGAATEVSTADPGFGQRHPEVPVLVARNFGIRVGPTTERPDHVAPVHRAERHLVRVDETERIDFKRDLAQEMTMVVDLLDIAVCDPQLRVSVEYVGEPGQHPGEGKVIGIEREDEP